VVLAAGAALAVQAPPRVGRPGKDILWVPTPPALVDGMLDMAKLTPRDVLIDLGSGDGRLVIAAAKRGATAVGIEYTADLVALARREAAAAGVQGRASFVRADLFEADLSTATVITLFLNEYLNLKLRPRLRRLAPGTRIVSNTFAMGDWEPDDLIVVREGCAPWCTAMLWIVR
jgi:SAM-dependent methyltransferase